jgi:hypothetical protein
MPHRKRPLTSKWDALLDPDTARLRANVPLDALFVPGGVEIIEGVLFFDWTASDYVKAPSGLLERFLRLQSDSTILTFARRYGPLGLSGSNPAPKVFDRQGAEKAETLASWRRYQREFNSLLALAAAVRDGESPDRDTFEEFRALGVGRFLTPEQASNPWARAFCGPPLEEWHRWSVRSCLDAAADLLKRRTTEFARSCGLRPALIVDRQSGEVSLAFQDRRADSVFGAGLSLFGALTVQLIAAATGAGFAVCSECGKAFVPARRQPAFGKRRFCRDCGRTAATRQAKADWRQREREKRRAAQLHN